LGDNGLFLSGVDEAILSRSVFSPVVKEQDIK